MSETHTITIKCDWCAKDLSPAPTGYPHRYILELRARDIALSSESGVVYSIAMKPPLPGTLHFCGEHCLHDWIVDRPKAVERSRKKHSMADSPSS